MTETRTLLTGLGSVSRRAGLMVAGDCELGHGTCPLPVCLADARGNGSPGAAAFGDSDGCGHYPGWSVQNHPFGPAQAAMPTERDRRV